MGQKEMRQLLCVVMDGVGVRASKFGNAVALARTPTLDWLRQNSLYTQLNAHGHFVGLPSDNDIGNSEVGHNALGAGNVIDQGAKLVNRAIDSGSLFTGETWKEAIQTVNAGNGTLHFLGLLSDGNVHSHENHLFAMLKESKANLVKKVRIHALLDGRDVPEKSAEIYVKRLESLLSELRSSDFDVQVASGGGRMRITMDRYGADWAMVKRGYDTHVHGIGPQYESLPAALAHFRQDPAITDQYIPEFVVALNGEPVGKIKSGDAVLFFNFRGDRSIEISRAFTEPDFNEFDRGENPKVFYAGMMEYDGDLHIPPKYLVSPPVIENTFSEFLLENKVSQFACSETQKFGHVTFFWNGNKSGYLDQAYEKYVEIPSDSNITFDIAPKMKAKEITDQTIQDMQSGKFGFGRINYANGDMVGHTGNLQAAIQAVEEVDTQLKRLVDFANQSGTILLVTADHGNADEMYEGKESDYANWESLPADKLPSPKTAHTLAPVPCYIYDPKHKPWHLAGIKEPGLGNVAGTCLTLMGLPKPERFFPSLVEGDL
jgi:2,3-bisphosphoglycerate-independent phosphoglycerate mutase